MIVVRAPLRISFGGGGTDLPAYYERFGGFVVSAAINRYCFAALTESEDRGIHLSSADYGVRESFGPGDIPEIDGPLSLPKAAIRIFADAAPVGRGIDLFLSSEVRPGTGLGGSSAMSVALMHALSAHTGRPMHRAEAAAEAARLEIEVLAKPIGKQDHYASAFGGLNVITFQRDATTVTPLGLPSAVLSRLDQRLLLFFTGASRDSARILTEQRRDTSKDGSVVESLNALKHLAMEMRDALVGGDLDAFGDLLHQGWCYKRKLSPAISSADIDRWYDDARDAGALGGKITGAGGGGYLLTFCAEGTQGTVRRALERHGLSEMRFGFDFEGARTMALADPQDAAPVSALVGAGSASPRSEARAFGDGEGIHA